MSLSLTTASDSRGWCQLSELFPRCLNWLALLLSCFVGSRRLTTPTTICPKNLNNLQRTSLICWTFYQRTSSSLTSVSLFSHSPSITSSQFTLLPPSLPSYWAGPSMCILYQPSWTSRYWSKYYQVYRCTNKCTNRGESRSLATSSTWWCSPDWGAPSPLPWPSGTRSATVGRWSSGTKVLQSSKIA